METIATFRDHEIRSILQPTMAAFLPLLEAKRAEIESIPKRTFKYGTTVRHQLDVYYPLQRPQNRTPILFFIYGGGFNTGQRSFPSPYDLVYACVGAYFARHGFLTVIPDYRLVPDVTYPAPAEDVRDAVIWVVQNAPLLTTDSVPHPDVNSLFILGHSAGAVHVATTLLHPELLISSTLETRIKGAILSGCPYHFHPPGLDPVPEGPTQYYGGAEKIRANDPLGLLLAAPGKKLAELPPIVIVQAENEPDLLRVVGDDFKAALSQRLGLEVKRIIGKGHNHISPNWALMTGEGERWAEEVVEWIHEILSKPGQEFIEV